MAEKTRGRWIGVVGGAVLAAVSLAFLATNPVLGAIGLVAAVVLIVAFLVPAFDHRTPTTRAEGRGRAGGTRP